MADSTTDQDVNPANAAAINEEQPPDEPENQNRSLSPLFRFLFPEDVVVVSEPKIFNPDPDLAQLGKEAQKLGPEWKTVRYIDVKKQFETKTPFCALYVNSELESLTPKCKAFEMLQRFDQTLAGISYGLLKQRKILQEAVDGLPAEMQEAARNAFLSANSPYKKKSDDLLQYVCGRRSQVIQHRRQMFLPRKLGVRDALHAIPPTDMLLFEQNRLSQLIEAFPNKIDDFAPNTEKCKCCQFHKLRRRQSTDAQNSGEDAQSTSSKAQTQQRKESSDTQSSEDEAPRKKRHHKQNKRVSSNSQTSEDEAPRRKRHQKRHRRVSSDTQNSEDEVPPKEGDTTSNGDIGTEEGSQ